MSPSTRKRKTSRRYYYRPNELPRMNILKSLSSKLKDGKSFLLMAYMDCPSVETRKLPVYRWEGIIASKESLDEMSKEMEKHFGDDWKWPNREGYQIQYKNVPKSRQGQEWFLNRISKAVPFEQFIKDLKYTQKNGWPIYGYVYDTGEPVNLLDENEILSKVGHQFLRERNAPEKDFALSELPEKIV